MATVRLKVNVGRTYNMGNFESLRVDVGLEEEVEVKPQGVEDAKAYRQDFYDRMFNVCEQALRREAQRLIKAIEDQHR